MYISGTTTANSQAIDAHVDAVIVPILRAYGAEITGRNYEDFYKVLTLEHRGQRISVPASVVGRTDPKALRFLLRHFDTVQEIVGRLMGISDPFYSDISIALDTAFGEGHHVDERVLAFSFICDRLRAAGKRIWTGD